MEQKLDGVLRVAAVEQVICGKTLDNADKEPANYELYIENVFLHPQISRNLPVFLTLTGKN